MATPFDGKVVLVTGGTGSFGRKFVKTVLTEADPSKVIVFSRDEWKQSEMRSEFQDTRIRFFLGDIRDLQRLQRAFRGVDIVIHAAALKQVPTLEYNPFEAVQTNIIGGENIITAAIDQGVSRVVALSTDKAANPANLYGATKLCMEKLFIAGNAYSGDAKTRFSVVRYGNVVGSRGSVVPLFLQKRKDGVLPITDGRMTRFWITLKESVKLVFFAAEHMSGGELFVPKIPSMKITDLAKAIAPDCELREIGIRPGEKLHEALMTEDECSRAMDIGEYFVVPPQVPDWQGNGYLHKAKTLPNDFLYESDKNDDWVTPEQVQEMVKDLAG